MVSSGPSMVCHNRQYATENSFLCHCPPKDAYLCKNGGFVRGLVLLFLLWSSLLHLLPVCLLLPVCPFGLEENKTMTMR